MLTSLFLLALFILIFNNCIRNPKFITNHKNIFLIKSLTSNGRRNIQRNGLEHEEKHVTANAIPKIVDNQAKTSPTGHADRHEQITIQILPMFLFNRSACRYHRSYRQEESFVGSSCCSIDHYVGISIRCILWDDDLASTRLSWSYDSLDPLEILSAYTFGYCYQARIR